MRHDKNVRNVIPRKAIKLKVHFKIQGYNDMVCTKDENGWHGVDADGNRFYCFVSYLRNNEICDIEILQ